MAVRPTILPSRNLPGTLFLVFGFVLAQWAGVASGLFRGKHVMKKFVKNVIMVALLVGVAGFSTTSRAETGRVDVVFTKGGFVVGLGAARAC